MTRIDSLRPLAAVCAAAILLLAAAGAQARCVGDCNGDNEVTVDEIVTAVNRALTGCPSECDDCDDADACTDDLCVAGRCVHEPVVCADDGEECTAELCDAATGCASVAVEDGTACAEGAGSCTAGVCVPAAVLQYEQDFEALDAGSETALRDDGWVVYGNVFDGTGRYLYGYGAFPAPNGGVAFAAIDAGQGGAGQGEQQLSIYNDYDNADHAKGYRIESNVYRERRIVAADVGTTILFGFDAKRGNINDPANELCPCTSTAIGFSTTATLYQPSAVFYDNIEIAAVPTAP